MNEQEYLQALVEMANANRDHILRSGSHTAALAEIIGEGDVVWGIWQDETCPYGVDSMIIKGRGRLMLIGQSTRGIAIKMTAVLCIEFAEAEAMRRVFGDGRGGHG